MIVLQSKTNLNYFDSIYFVLAIRLSSCSSFWASISIASFRSEILSSVSSQIPSYCLAMASIRSVRLAVCCSCLFRSKRSCLQIRFVLNWKLTRYNCSAFDVFYLKQFGVFKTLFYTNSINSSSVKMFASLMYSLKKTINSFQSSSTKIQSGIPHFRSNATFCRTTKCDRLSRQVYENRK